MLAGGINVVTVSLMVTVFTMTGGLTGVEVGIAGGSAALLQTILEAYFGAGRAGPCGARTPRRRVAVGCRCPGEREPRPCVDKVLVDKLAAAVESAREVLA